MSNPRVRIGGWSAPLVEAANFDVNLNDVTNEVEFFLDAAPTGVSEGDVNIRFTLTEAHELVAALNRALRPARSIPVDVRPSWEV